MPEIWTTTEEHEKMLRTTQRRIECFVSSFRQRESTKRPTKKTEVEKDIQNDERSEDTQEEDSTNDEYDQDSSISLEKDTERTSSQEDGLEDWIEYIKHTTSQVGSKHKLKFRQALRIAIQAQTDGAEKPPSGIQDISSEDDLDEIVADE